MRLGPKAYIPAIAQLIVERVRADHERERAENDWSAYAVTLNQRIDRLTALARRRGIDEDSIAEALRGDGR